MVRFFGTIAFVLLLAVVAANSCGAPAAAAQPVQPDGGLHVTEIRAWCAPGVGVGGTVEFVNDGPMPVTQDVKLYLTYHVPGDGTWYPTGDQVVVHVQLGPGESKTVHYEMSSTPQTGANSYRVENDFDTTKSLSWPGCSPNAVTLAGFGAAAEPTLGAGEALLLLVLAVAVVMVIRALLRGAFPRIE